MPAAVGNGSAKPTKETFKEDTDAAVALEKGDAPLQSFRMLAKRPEVLNETSKASAQPI
jgi:hypothetical protein